MLKMPHLLTLTTISDCDSFADAAVRLGITQSAVCMQMKALEDELGANIFDRSKRSPVLNDLGRGLIETAQEILDLGEDLRQAAAKPEVLVGALRLGVISSVSTGALPEALGRLKDLHPKLHIKIENGFTPDLALRVNQGTLDAAIITEPSRIEKGLTCRTVIEEPLLVIAPASAAGASYHELLSEYPFARFNRNSGLGIIIESALRSYKIRVQDAMELDSIEAILQMVARGLGVSVVPEHCVTERYLKLIHVASFGDLPHRRKVGLIERKRHQRSYLTNVLLDELKKAENLRRTRHSKVFDVAKAKPS